MTTEILKISNLSNVSAFLRIRGADANTFLQGQFTQNLRFFLGEAAYGLWLNQKGKVIADSQVLRPSDEECLVLSFRTSAEVLRPRLEGYIIADDVLVQDESSKWAALALWGEGAAGVVERLGGIVPAPDRFALCGGGFVLPGRWSRRPNFTLVCPADEGIAQLAQACAWGACEVLREEAERERIAGGIPAVPEDIGPGDLPNEGGLDEEAVSYTKGCYLGQEVMSRLKNLGQVRRRLHVVRGSGPPPAAHTPVLQSEQRVGETRSAARDGDGFVAMAMLSLVNYDAQHGAVLPDGRPLAVSPLSHG